MYFVGKTILKSRCDRGVHFFDEIVWEVLCFLHDPNIQNALRTTMTASPGLQRIAEQGLAGVIQGIGRATDGLASTIHDIVGDLACAGKDVLKDIASAFAQFAHRGGDVAENAAAAHVATRLALGLARGATGLAVGTAGGTARRTTGITVGHLFLLNAPKFFGVPGSPPPPTVAIMSASAIRLLRKSGVRSTAGGIMMITRPRGFLTGCRVDVLTAKLLSAFPTPRSTTACSRCECT